MKITVISSVYGDYDEIKIPPEQSVECDYILVTGEPVDCAPWHNVVEPRPRVHPRLASRVPKCNPQLYTDADVTIWVDGNIEITSPDFVKWCVESLGDDQIALGRLKREDAYQEVLMSRRIGTKWDGDALDEQLALYVSDGYPADYGIWWGGFIVRSHDCPPIGNEWLAEMVRWTCQDQIALSYLLFLHGIVPADLPFMFDQIQWQLLPGDEDGTVKLTYSGFKCEHFNLKLHPADV